MSKKKQPGQYTNGSEHSRKDRDAAAICEAPATASASEVYHRVILRKTPDSGIPVPWINFSGRYLEKWGFYAGSKLAIQLQDGKIIITIEAPPLPWEEYEARKMKTTGENWIKRHCR